MGSFQRTCSSETGAFKIRELSPQEVVKFTPPHPPKLTNLNWQKWCFGGAETSLIWPVFQLVHHHRAAERVDDLKVSPKGATLDVHIRALLPIQSPSFQPCSRDEVVMLERDSWNAQKLVYDARYMTSFFSESTRWRHT